MNDDSKFLMPVVRTVARLVDRGHLEGVVNALSEAPCSGQPAYARGRGLRRTLFARLKRYAAAQGRKIWDGTVVEPSDSLHNLLSQRGIATGVGLSMAELLALR